MTNAPDDLMAVQRYLHDRTGQPWASLGITHQTPNGGGYHEGEDLLIAARRAPGPQYPYSDYSYTDSPRDLLPSGRLAGGNNASAFDLGGGFKRFLEFNAWMEKRMLANDPRTSDIREMIHTLDGRTVRRIDRTWKQGDSGDDSHLSHTHFSFFRDSLGRRDRNDNFMGLIKEFFDGIRSSDEMATNDVSDILYLLKHILENNSTLKPDGKHNQIVNPATGHVLAAGSGIKQQLDNLSRTTDEINNSAGNVLITDAQLDELKTFLPSAKDIVDEMLARMPRSS